MIVTEFYLESDYDARYAELARLRIYVRYSKVIEIARVDGYRRKVPNGRWIGSLYIPLRPLRCRAGVCAVECSEIAREIGDETDGFNPQTCDSVRTNIDAAGDIALPIVARRRHLGPCKPRVSCR